MKYNLSHAANLTSRKSIAVLSLSILAILFLSSNLGLVVAAQSASQVQANIDWQFMQGSTPQNSYFVITVNVTSSSLGTYHVLASGTHGSTPLDRQSCMVSLNNGQTTQSCTFTLRFAGSGHYDFYASVTGQHGQTVAYTSVDPLVEPEWRK